MKNVQSTTEICVLSGGGVEKGQYPYALVEQHPCTVTCETVVVVDGSRRIPLGASCFISVDHVARGASLLMIGLMFGLMLVGLVIHMSRRRGMV